MNRCRKPVMLIGGAPGAGKTTLARALCHALTIDHRISTGFIREIVRDQFTKQSCPLLFDYTFRSADPIRTLVLQAALLQRPVSLCLRRAREEGTSLIVEGNHLIPALYHDVDADLYVILGAPVAKEHRKRLRGDTHRLRVLTEADLLAVRKIDDYLRREAERHAIPLRQFRGALDEFTQLLTPQPRD